MSIPPVVPPKPTTVQPSTVAQQVTDQAVVHQATLLGKYAPTPSTQPSLPIAPPPQTTPRVIPKVKTAPVLPPTTPKHTAPVAPVVTPKQPATTSLLDKYAAHAEATTEHQAQIVPSTPQVTPVQHSQVAASTMVKASQLVLPPKAVIDQIPALATTQETSGRLEKHEVSITDLNDQQREAVQLAESGESFVLIGAAGSGKTTTQRVVIQALAATGLVKLLPPEWTHKHIPKGCQSIAIVSFMNRAVNNIRQALPDEFKPNALTIHKLLEYAPVEEDYIDIDEDGNTIDKVRKVFRPQRNKDNLLVGLTHVVVEEASTINIPLFEELLDALPNHGRDVTFIFLGDIKQLPPVFGKAILSTKIQTLPVVELTHIYRTANDSPIKLFATYINEGVPCTDLELREMFAREGELEFLNLSGKRANGTRIPRRLPQEVINPIVNSYKLLLDSGEFVPFRDTILCPYRVNKDGGVNCDNINIQLADHAGKAREATVYEVVCGFDKKYLAVDDPVIMNKQEYLISDIQPNKAYIGIPAKYPHVGLDRYGQYNGDEAMTLDLGGEAELAQILETTIVMATTESVKEEEAETRRLVASHIIKLTPVDDSTVSSELEVTSSSDIASIEFAYATTVHKSIGSEWDRVYLCTHHKMVGMMSRELLYTAVTRAKLFLQVVFDGHNWDSHYQNTSLISKAIITPRIQGVTLQQKLDWLARQDEDTSKSLDKYKPK